MLVKSVTFENLICVEISLRQINQDLLVLGVCSIQQHLSRCMNPNPETDYCHEKLTQYLFLKRISLKKP